MHGLGRAIEDGGDLSKRNRLGVLDDLAGRQRSKKAPQPERFAVNAHTTGTNPREANRDA